MTEHHRPIPESYWVEPGHFLAGEYPGQYDEESTRKRIDVLIEAGFDTLIDLTRTDEMFPYKKILLEQAAAYGVNVTHDRFPIGDFGLPTPELMNDLLDKIEERLGTGHKIYLHCWGGIGRTGTTVGCYLVRHGKTAEEALDQLSAWWRRVPKSHYHPHSPETHEQVNFIRTWAGHDSKLQKSHK
jgi:protein-tyrosine phosphatase